MELYLDLFILENTILNLFVIFICSKLLNKKIPFYKTLIGAFCGTFFALIIIVYNPALMQRFFIKILISSILVFIIYFPKNLGSFFRIFSCFLLSAMLVAGTMFFLIANTYGNMLSYEEGYLISASFNIYVFILTFTICFFLVKILCKLKKDTRMKEKILTPLSIFIEEKNISINALIDTGNLLCDPLTNLPVIITEYSALKNLLPSDLQILLDTDETLNLSSMNEWIYKKNWFKRLRLIPYKALGNENDLILGFRPDSIKIGDDNKKSNNVIIGICKQSLSKDKQFQALIGPELII